MMMLKIISFCGHKLGKIKWLKKLLTPINDKYIEYLKFHRNQLFLKNGIRVLKELDELLAKYQINYSLTYGSLLGAVREKGLIAYDFDFDVCIWATDFKEEMQSYLEADGFKLSRRFLVDDGKSGREETYTKDGVDIDFFYVYSDSQYPSYSCCFKVFEDCSTFSECMKKHSGVVVRRLQIPVSRKTERIHFANIEVSVMTNCLEFLKVCYGENFMTPDPFYKPKDDDGVRFIWKGKKGSYQG